MSNQEIHNTTTSNGHSIEKAEGLQVIDGREYYEDLKVAYVLPKDTDGMNKLNMSCMPSQSLMVLAISIY